MYRNKSIQSNLISGSKSLLLHIYLCDSVFISLSLRLFLSFSVFTSLSAYLSL